MSDVYLGLAVLVASVHFIWILIVSVGSLLAILGKLRKEPNAEALYLGVVGFTVLNRVLSPDCWLTRSELYLRKLSTGVAVTYGFIDHYLGLLGFSLERGVLFLIGAIWISAGLVATAMYYVFDLQQLPLAGE